MDQTLDLVLKLLEHSAAMGASGRSLARAAGVAPGTVTGWKRGASPGSTSICKAGLSLGWRLELLPTEADYPGAADAPRPQFPHPADWWKSYRLPPLVRDPLVPEYLLSLIGAEIHWARAVITGRSRFFYADNNRGQTWALVERGPGRGEEATIARVAEAARNFNLELTWILEDAPWRVRPWQVPGAPPRPPRVRSPG